MGDYIEIDTSNLKNEEGNYNLFEERERIASLSVKKYSSEVTILLKAYNGLEKTKRCVESLLKYTSNVDYDLWLIDNGSTDGTLEYFRSVPYSKKNILRITDNRGAMIPDLFFNMSMFSKYVAILASDLVFTKDWLRNLITVAKSDRRIGMVNPMSSNVSNYQDPGLQFKNEEEMQKKAAEFNVSDPRKWHERLRLVTLGTVFTKECFFAIGYPFVDVGFSHNFADDDMSFRVRRAGYKAILACDTWIHHDDVKDYNDREKTERLHQNLRIGRHNFIDKYRGIDAWDDCNNYIMQYVPVLRPADDAGKARILGINVRCGTPILEIKNYMRQFDVFDTECFAYTSNQKYCPDLMTICGVEHVQLGELSDLRRYYDTGVFSHIVIGDPINMYEDYLHILEEAYRILKPGGQIFFSIYNTRNIYELMGCLGHYDIKSPEYAYSISIDELGDLLSRKGISNRYISAKKFAEDEVSKNMETIMSSIVDKLNVSDRDTCLFRLFSKYYYVQLVK